MAQPAVLLFRMVGGEGGGSGSVASLQRPCSQSAVWALLQCEAIVIRDKRLCSCVCVCACDASGGYLSRERIAVAILHGILCLHSVSLCCQISWCILHFEFCIGFAIFLHFFRVCFFHRREDTRVGVICPRTDEV